MADVIDIAKLKTGAFEAIDAFFGESDEDASSGKQALEKTGQLSDEFTVLEEYTLALDWEYSDKELNRLTRHLDRLTLKYPDKHNQSLVKIIKSIINYLQKAREKAYPQTLTVMASVINTLKDINTKDFNEAGIKLKLNSTYNEAVSLKEKISIYNKKLRKHIEKKKEVLTENVSDFKPGSEEKITKIVYNTEAKGIDVNILTRLDQLDEKISYLEKQNSALKRLMIDQHQGVAGTVISDFNSGMKEDIGAEFGVDSFSTEKEPFSPIEEPVTVDVDDISFDSATLPAIKGKMFTPGTDDQEEIVFQSENMKVGKPDYKEDYVEYVKFFKVGRQVVALPDDYINNTYRLPPNIRKKIYSMESISLEDLSSGFQKLSRKIRRIFQNRARNKLKGINATVKILDSAMTMYNYAVLCSCGDTHVIIPVTGRHKSKLTLTSGMNKTNSKISEYSVEIDGMGKIPLVIPC